MPPGFILLIFAINIHYSLMRLKLIKVYDDYDDDQIDYLRNQVSLKSNYGANKAGEVFSKIIPPYYLGKT